MGIHGLILQHSETEAVFICLGNRSWATMVWPLVEVSRMCYKLDSRAGVAASFHDHSEWQASVSSPVWVDDIGVCLKHSQMEPLPKAALRKSTCLTFGEIVTLADSVGMAGGEKLSRPDLVKRLCGLFQDEGFTEFVTSQEDAAGKSKCQPQVSADPILAPELLDQMDKDEAKEFQDIKKKLCPKVAVKRKWQEIYRSSSARSPNVPKPRLEGFNSIPSNRNCWCYILSSWYCCW